mmetsp:Transcript_3910/g.7452  ORF Transcript_3910/g.7452 Transcript_3910/m.7452 type:complete len:770 (-) Transcript_3910:242-2551(-)|eukprot:CAMPEP_0113311354 /NCGR_PEP_ID=MMETSP0010_2-20120614/8627_1 /TAXON_ID=216773 ORGANISM="Corethron hystrix, Strain 308" /NCGR_SAMPLE_ID=MMETSP0010_2 /ASSEMBLY_ACC=CAM_ASM_000155 /LENGTH=769 /DNA_ID=CAMNT_0000166981 /DNA_START=247 /DNA_END=2556 /DNA_ORIENTATION=+ /assembly_acc=CAM_ASM_000155
MKSSLVSTSSLSGATSARRAKAGDVQAKDNGNRRISWSNAYDTHGSAWKVSSRAQTAGNSVNQGGVGNGINTASCDSRSKFGDNLSVYQSNQASSLSSLSASSVSGHINPYGYQYQHQQASRKVHDAHPAAGLHLMAESASMSFGGLSDALSETARRALSDSRNYYEGYHHQEMPHHALSSMEGESMLMEVDSDDGGGRERPLQPSGHQHFSSSLSVADMSINSLSDAASMLEEVGESAARRIFGHGQHNPYHHQQPAAVHSSDARFGRNGNANDVDMGTIARKLMGVGNMPPPSNVGSNVESATGLECVNSIGTFDMQSMHSHSNLSHSLISKSILQTPRGSDVNSIVSISKVSSISGLTGSQFNILHRSNLTEEDFDSGSNIYSTISKDPPRVTLLAVPEDSSALNELQCFIRQNVEVFSASASDVDECLAARKRIAPGQVGMRCMHCAHKPLPERAEQAVSYPPSVSNIYQRVLIMGQVHFEACPSVPPDVVETFRALKTSTSRVRFSRKYWIQAAEKIGLMDSEDGIQFKEGMPMVGGQDEMQDLHGPNGGLNSSGPNGPSHHGRRICLNFPLVTEEDRCLITDFQFVMMQQMQPCIFTESDTNKHGRRLDIQAGFSGLECRHCEGRGGLGKYFPVNAKRLREPRTHSAFTSHIMKCNKCPQEVKNNLSAMQKKHSEQSTRLRRGSQKEFFERVWHRLHGASSDDEDMPGAGGDGRGEAEEYAEGPPVEMRLPSGTVNRISDPGVSVRDGGHVKSLGYASAWTRM